MSLPEGLTASGLHTVGTATVRQDKESGERLTFWHPINRTFADLWWSE